MKAMVLNRLGSLEENRAPLEMAELPDPVPGEHEILIKVSACGVCHTELDEIEGRTPPPRLPVVLGHQVVGRVISSGPPRSSVPSPPRSGGSGDSQPRDAASPSRLGGYGDISASPPRSGSTGVPTGDSQPRRFKIGDRVGVAWIYSACGHCKFCLSGNENLCPDFQATGRDANGGYAQYMTVREDFAYPIPDVFSDVEAAPLLCAGAIGYRSLMLANLQDGQKLGLTGFGASAHLVLKMVRHRYPGVKVFVFARSAQERAFARELGAAWAGDTLEESPEKLDSIIDTTPVWTPVVEALKNLEPGGRLVINAIRKENVDQEYLLRLDYPAHLWLEKEIKSVANVARSDVSGFLALAAEIPIKPEVEEFALEEANTALVELKMRKIRGAKVLRVDW
jgi:propanol-preferring alcohol dehydrogenase